MIVLRSPGLPGHARNKHPPRSWGVPVRWSTFALVALLCVMVAPGVAAAPSDGPAAGLDSACFGAAARDPNRPQCRSVERGSTVFPSPADALTLPNSPCQPQRAQSGPPVCAFGAAPSAARRTTALVGDRHAGHWRAALTVVARANGWSSLSITHSSCPLQKALRDLPGPTAGLRLRTPAP